MNNKNEQTYNIPITNDTGVLIEEITTKLQQFDQDNKGMLIYERLKCFKEYSQSQWYNNAILQGDKENAINHMFLGIIPMVVCLLRELLFPS